ncbi:MAG: BACON domain-containing carbohydrate-binding protein [Desulfobacteraceae bacterium]|jgi:hypothetical protein|nr:BACON domain-containing carbohydrate-binding protein [Desulfobacteraceae bacterium]
MKKYLFGIAVLLIVVLSNGAVYAATGGTSWVHPAWQDQIQRNDFASEETKTIGTFSTPTCNSEQAVVALLKDKFSQRVTSFSFNMVYGFSFSEVGGILSRAKEAAVADDDYLAFSIQAYNNSWSGYNGDVGVTYSVTYLSTFSQEQEVATRVDAILGSIITAGMNDEEKEKKIHDWVVANVAYDESLKEHSAWAALFLGKTVCQGYSLLTCKMLQEVDVPVRIINSEAMNHAWNMIYLCGHWYHLDVTWNDPVPDLPGRILYTYYNLSDSEIQGMSPSHYGWSGAAPAAPVSYVEGICALTSNLSVTPSNRNVAKESGTTTFSVSNTGAGTMPWSAQVVSGTGWLSITFGNSGSNTGTITCNFTPNSTSSSRTGTIRITATGASGSPKNVTVTQAGTPAVTLSGLTINGPASVDENSTATFTATANWSNGSTSVVTPSWSENSAYASINESGVLIAVDVTEDQLVMVTASYTSGGITENAIKSITILNHENIIFYEGFEGQFFATDYGDIPVGWNAYGSETIQFSKITSAFEGNVALRAAGTFDSAEWTALQKEFTVLPGASIEVALKIRVDANTPMYVGTEMGICFREGTSATCEDFVWYSDSGSYESRSARFTVATGNFYVIIKLGAADGGGIASFDLDAVTITVNDKNTGDTIGLFNPDSSVFYLKNETTGGNADTKFQFGPKPSIWTPFAGDWNGNSQSTVGLFDPKKSRFFMTYTHDGGYADKVFDFGPDNRDWQPITGDWNGNGNCSIGLYDAVNGKFYLKDSLSGGNADYVIRFGPKDSDWQPVTGDWDGDGRDSIGLYSSKRGKFYLKNGHTGSGTDIVLRYGPTGQSWTSICGDWDGNGTDGVGLFKDATSTFYLKNNFSDSATDIRFDFGPDKKGWKPLAGNW